MVEKDEKKKRKIKIKNKKEKRKTKTKAKPKKRVDRTAQNLVNLSRRNSNIPMSQPAIMPPQSTVGGDLVRQALLNVGNGRMPSNTNQLRDILASQSLSKDAGISNTMRTALLGRLNQGDFNTTRNPRQPVFGPSNRVRTSLFEPAEKYYDTMMKGAKKGKDWIKDNWNMILPAGVAVGAIDEEQASRWGGADGADRFTDEAVSQITTRGREFINSRMNNRRRPPPPPPSNAERINDEIEHPRNFEGAGRFSDGLSGTVSARTITSILGVGGALAMGGYGLQQLRNMVDRNVNRQEVGERINENVRMSEPRRNTASQVLARQREDAFLNTIRERAEGAIEKIQQGTYTTPLSGREQASMLSAPNTPEQTISQMLGEQQFYDAKQGRAGLILDPTTSRYSTPETVAANAAANKLGELKSQIPTGSLGGGYDKLPNLDEIGPMEI